MLVNLLAIILILLITGYYATQGLFSATLSLIAAIFGSILAMGLFEPLSGIIGGFRPAYGRGITFLLLFFLALSACRLAADFGVPKNIRFTKLIDSIGGGVIGFFAAMVIIGSCIIGCEMLPLPTSVFGTGAMGFDRYPDASGMAGSQDGVPAAPKNVWFAPDRLTLGIWGMASGRGLGGGSFTDIHPDLTVESYGYRNMVSYSSNAALPPDLLSVPDAYTIDNEPPKSWGVPATSSIVGKRLAVVRIEVAKGTDQPKISADSDGFFRVTPSQVRLVTDKGHQYYPVGQLTKGVTFEPISLEPVPPDPVPPETKTVANHLVEDYVGDKVIEDWVFAIEHDETPAAIEIKQLARVDLKDKLREKPVAALAAAQYPKRDYLLQRTTLTIATEIKAGGAHVFIMPDSTKIDNIFTPVKNAHDAILEHVHDINNGVKPWSEAAGTVGVPSNGDMESAVNNSRSNILTAADTSQVISWSQVVPIIMMSECKTSGAQNVTHMPEAFKSLVEPLLNKHSEVRAHGETAANGVVELTGVAPGKYEVIVSLGTEDGYYLWIKPVTLLPKTPQTVPLAAKDAVFVVKKPPPTP